VTRRNFVALMLAWTIGPSGVLAQSLPHRPLIAILLGGSRATVQHWLTGFPEGLRDLGYIEHRDYEVEYRYADGDLRRLTKLATELISLNPNIVVVGNTAAALAAKRAMPNVPIVVAAATNPVRFGLAKSRPEPGGNITGMLAGFESLAGRQLELGLELLPGKSQAGILFPANVTSEVHWQNARAAAEAKGADLSWVTASVPTDLNKAMNELASRQVDYVIVPADAMFLSERPRIAELASSLKIPAIYAFREQVEAGGLISYGVNLREQFRRAAGYVDKILKGASPSNLPFEQPTKFELMINLRAAKELDLTVPAPLIERADEVIE
jgi:putative ABC transport system substrate-binding protein